MFYDSTHKRNLEERPQWLKGGRGWSPEVEHSPGMCESLDLTPSATKKANDKFSVMHIYCIFKFFKGIVHMRTVQGSKEAKTEGTGTDRLLSPASGSCPSHQVPP